MFIVTPLWGKHFQLPWQGLVWLLLNLIVEPGLKLLYIQWILYAVETMTYIVRPSGLGNYEIGRFEGVQLGLLVVDILFLKIASTAYIFICH